ncbi:MAG: histone deacetylase family protein [Deltaproteobacteria bacterium]|nr:histone deacetylase family protein [Deltaproteobacteria bacterium]
MFRIRKVVDPVASANQEAIRQVQEILRAQFPDLPPEDVEKVPQQLLNPMRFGFRATLFVAEDGKQRIKGFAMVFHEPELRFAFLDYVASAAHGTSGGVGGALYERVREEARALGADALYFECLPDDPTLSPHPEIRAQNAARLRFYERWGARPVANTAYETPVTPDSSDPPYLVVDLLGSPAPLPKARAVAAVRAILDRKYRGLCSPEYNALVLSSFTEDPVALRPPRYQPDKVASAPLRDLRIPLFVNEKHDIHHIRERGYVESPVRISAILKGLEPTGWFERRPPLHVSDAPIRAVHDRQLVDYLHEACLSLPEGKSVYPYVFPVRNTTRPPKELPLRAGYFCIDTFTPLNRNAYLAARGAVDCALGGADALLEGRRLAYALVRPPGHHAERKVFGGFCYFNSAAVAAHHLSAYGRVAVLDVDYHHGNGTQDIFYHRADVLTVSIHGTPRVTYPYFSGFEDERGEGEGQGYNLNLPQREGLDGPAYLEALDEALARIRRFRPSYLVLSLGFDTARDDPTGSFTLRAADFQANGRRIGALGVPTLVVQEGGYRVRSLAASARSFFRGLIDTAGCAPSHSAAARR